MFWQNGELKSPLSGKLLERDSAFSLRAGDERFPIVDEIPFLRAGRQELKDEVLQALKLQDKRAALILLLRDQDDWARTPPPNKEDLNEIFENQILTLRSAMQILRYGAVADYFAYRWSDPTFLSGLSLLENYLPANASQVFELCCGIGHFLREFLMRGFEPTGADVVFSKLWLARKFVAPAAKLVCCDANYSLPFAENSFEAAFCHDAFYFLPKKAFVVDELKRVVGPKGALLIGHAHNAGVNNFSSGAAITVKEYAELFDNPILYDDAELTNSAIENRMPQAQAAEDLYQAEAIAIIAEFSQQPIAEKRTSFVMPQSGARLQLNPLLEGENQEILLEPQYPSELYEAEYAPLSKYLYLKDGIATFADRAKAFYGDWHLEPRTINLVRRRIFLDLPEKW